MRRPEPSQARQHLGKTGQCLYAGHLIGYLSGLGDGTSQQILRQTRGQAD